MKKTFIIILLTSTSVMMGSAQEVADSNSYVTLNDIVKREAENKSNQDDQAFHEKLWNKRSYLNISYVSAKLQSSEFPTAGGTYDREFKSSAGVNLQYGHTYDFHKKPIADMVFIGLNYTGIDLSYAKYNAEETPAMYVLAGKEPYPTAWHNKKQTIDYGMALGPAVTVYPFASLGKPETDKIRLQVYFQVGYNARVTIISDMPSDPVSDKMKTVYSFAHGLSTKIGASLTWDFVGLGFELWNAPSYKNTYFDDKYDTGSMKSKVKSSRVFLQFRF